MCNQLLEVDFQEEVNFIKKHIKKDDLLIKFIKNQDNYNSLANFLNNPSRTSKLNFDKAFRKFYFYLRFVTYISKTIHFLSINFDKKENKIQKKEELSLDTPIKDGTSRLHLIEDKYEKEEYKIEEMFTNIDVYSAFKKLTSKQQLILELAYIYQYKDVEIAKYLHCSQQAVSKARKRVLEILRKSLLGE